MDPTIRRFWIGAGQRRSESRQNDNLNPTWSLKSPEGGDEIAQSNRGNMYRIGDGVPGDSAESAKWHRKVADRPLDLALLLRW